MISEVGIYKTADGFEKTQPLPEAYTKFVYGDDERLELNKGSWDDDHQGNTGWEKQEDGSYTTTDGWANIKYTFEGTYFALVGTKGPDYGSFDIYIDGKYTSSANASAGEITPGQILYESPTLGAGTHTIQLTTGTNRKPVNFAYGYYLGTNENGLFEIETDSYQVTEGDSIKVKIKRNGGSTGEVTVNVTTPPGTAVQGQYYENITNETITFKDGEKVKYVTLKTIDNLDVTGNKDFYVEIFSPTGGAQLGMRSTARILIVENDKRIADAVEQTSNISESWYKAESWDAFDQAYLKAKAAVDDDSMSDDEKMKLSNALMEAYNNLEVISQYSVRNAMILPDNFEDEKVLEVELGILDSKHENIVANEYLKMVNGSDYSNGRLINKIKDGNTITIPLNVQKTGLYNFDFTYQATQPMSLIISGDHIAKQTISLDASETLTEKSIPLNIQETGVSQVVITAKSLAKSDGDLAIDNAKIKLQEVSNGKIESIAIEQMPSKTVYALGDTLDLTGLKVIAKYDTGATTDITHKVEVTGFDSSKVGEQTLTVHYGEFETQFTVTVKGKSDEINPGTDTPEKPGQDNPNQGNSGQTGEKPSTTPTVNGTTSSHDKVKTSDEQVIGVFVIALLGAACLFVVMKNKKSDSQD